MSSKPALNCQKRTFPTDDVLGRTFNYHIRDVASAGTHALLAGGSLGAEIEYRPTMTFANPGPKAARPL
jgi:hypothetical protein